MSDELPITDAELMARAVGDRTRKNQHGEPYKNLTPPAVAKPSGPSAEQREELTRYKRSLRPLNVRERTFVHAMLGDARGNPAKAAELAGFKPALGWQIARRPAVQRALRSAMTLAEARTGVVLDKDRLLRELDHALTQAKDAFTKPVRAPVECKKCGSSNITCGNCGARVAKVEVEIGPKEVANLTTATSRAVAEAAKIIGALAPLEHKHQHSYQASGSYAEILRMLRERPGMFTPAQIAQIREAAVEEREEIEALLAELDGPPATTH